MYTQHCCYWCPGAKAPGHQCLQCWLYTDSIGSFSYINISSKANNIRKLNHIFENKYPGVYGLSHMWNVSPTPEHAHPTHDPWYAIRWPSVPHVSDDGTRRWRLSPTPLSGWYRRHPSLWHSDATVRGQRYSHCLQEDFEPGHHSHSDGTWTCEQTTRWYQGTGNDILFP